MSKIICFQKKLLHSEGKLYCVFCLPSNTWMVPVKCLIIEQDEINDQIGQNFSYTKKYKHGELNSRLSPKYDFESSTFSYFEVRKSRQSP